MFDKTITVFNFRADLGKWFVSVIENADIVAERSENATQHGEQNANGVEILVQSDAEGNVETTEGVKSYVKPKFFGNLDTPESYITFQPLVDFIYEGAYDKTSPIIDADCDEIGLYHKLNSELDGVHQVVSCTRYTLIPHLEVVCK